MRALVTSPLARFSYFGLTCFSGVVIATDRKNRLVCACGATYWFEAREFYFDRGRRGGRLVYFPSPDVYIKCASCGRLERQPDKVTQLRGEG